MKKFAIITGLMLLAIGVNAQELNKKNTGMRVSAQISASLDVADNEIENIDKNLYSINLRLGLSYFIIPKISLGAGIGLDNYQNPKTKSFPIFFDAKYYIFDARNTPFVYGTAGKLIRLSDSFQNGTMADVGIGYKFFAGDNLCLNATIGYSFRNLRNLNITEYNSNEISLGLGIMF